MSLATGYSLQVEGIKLLGYSVAGITTSVALPELDLCFDVGQGLPYQIPFSNILITHGHMDHASGLPYIISMKAMMGQVTPKIYMPAALVEPMTRIMATWAEIDQHEYRFHFTPVANEQSYPLKGNFSFRPFATQHRVASHGYTIFEKKKRLKDEYRGLAQSELGPLRKKGVSLEEFEDEPVLSFTGDTKIEFLDAPSVKKSRVLVMEVTYWDQKKSVANAREWGHIHFDELLQRLDEIESRKIVLIHASARYVTSALEEIIQRRVPEKHRERIVIFPRPM